MYEHISATSIEGVIISGTIIGIVPAANADLIPFSESSMTYELDGGHPSSAHARTKISGAGLLCLIISPPIITEKKESKPDLVNSFFIRTESVDEAKAISLLESGDFSHSESGENRQSESNNKDQSPGLYLLN